MIWWYHRKGTPHRWRFCIRRRVFDRTLNRTAYETALGPWRFYSHR
jgi:hypothetical protein